jgi:hypothetical protein
MKFLFPIKFVTIFCWANTPCKEHPTFWVLIDLCITLVGVMGVQVPTSNVINSLIGPKGKKILKKVTKKGQSL